MKQFVVAALVLALAGSLYAQAAKDKPAESVKKAHPVVVKPATEPGQKIGKVDSTARPGVAMTKTAPEKSPAAVSHMGKKPGHRHPHKGGKPEGTGKE
jgi:hypothetical protein